MSQRLQQLEAWLKRDLGLPGFDLEPASADASFRRYFRIRFSGETRIVMDAPPEFEDVRPFVRLSGQLHELGLNVPRVLEQDIGQGFLLLDDLGSQPYLAALDGESADRLYGDALGALMTLQACGPVDGDMPRYDRPLLMQEMTLFLDWFLVRHLGLTPDDDLRERLSTVFGMLADEALRQPRVCVHRDYHSRNLMVHGEHNPGILDFQDAVVGPVTYDLVSLLRDCYIAWPRERVEDWALGYHEIAVHAGILHEEDERGFLRSFDLMGVQRHLKAIGIFARLHHRDGKPGYLADIPRTLDYVREVSARYPQLAGLHDLIEERIVPAMAATAPDAASC